MNKLDFENIEISEIMGFKPPFGHVFLTGSRRYGFVKPDSDIDLVMPVDLSAYNILYEMADKTIECEDNKNYQGKSVYFGKLNLVLVIDQAIWDGWLKGTLQLEKEGPVTREYACATFAEIFKNVANNRK